MATGRDDARGGPDADPGERPSVVRVARLDGLGEPADGSDLSVARLEGFGDAARVPAPVAVFEALGSRSGRGRAQGGPGPDPAEGEELADPEAVARAICLRLLTDRARPRQELVQALRKRGVPDEAAAVVLERFGDVGLIDDAVFAGQWVHSRHEGRGLGRRAIAIELRRKGVDDEVAGEALAEVDTEAEEQRARRLVDRKLQTVHGEIDAAVARRMLGMLARKGYPAGVAYRVVKEAVAEHAAELAEQLPAGQDD